MQLTLWQRLGPRVRIHGHSALVPLRDMSGYVLTRLPAQYNGTGKVFESLQVLALVSSAGGIPLLRNAASIPKLVRLAHRMRAAGPRAASNSTFLTFGTGQST
eukprot:281217-Amphidinium_carterae.1